MSITVETGDPRAPQAQALLEASHALMQELFPAESNHYLSVDALCGEDIRFLVAQDGEQTLGCGAVALKGDYGEVKSMFVASEARGHGVANKLMEALIETARAEGLKTLKLETGNSLTAAHKLYEKHGFTYCGPFGDYEDDPLSLFMERPL
ncbi:GNAT family N-acetyltransferase [Halocynthiibacter sp. C4]|uniref:GNAT family N-acetyltransferase n=1 Tax=Halocynthiibacter sp. C4 TaxID=2992758 RepID=UPI00237B6D3A|nr:GNAT family N-acetyltransferase [Halocynthiibacter sp. C4]MDE0590806.1 GNAT family N-acetyltransferase [Halocynthiibacter sp. C4]